MPAALLPWIGPQFTDASGDPVASGKLYSFVAGLDTPQPCYTDSDLAIAHSNPILLNAAGRAASNIYLLHTGYKFRLDDAEDVTLFTVDNVSDIGAVFAATFGTLQSAGGKSTTSGYTVLETDRLVTVSSTGGASPCIINLLPAADATAMLTIKNVGTVALSVTPNGSDVIDSVNAAYTVPAAAAPVQPAITVVSDHVSAWYIVASHGIA